MDAEAQKGVVNHDILLKMNAVKNTTTQYLFFLIFLGVISYFLSAKQDNKQFLT